MRSRDALPAGAARRARPPAWLWPALLIVAACGAAYGPALRGGFVWDDRATILADPRVQGQAPAAEIWRGPFMAPAVQTFGRPYYRPLTTLSFRLDRARGGGDPGAFHLTNLWLHVAASLLALGVARRWLPGTWPPLAVALFFALHPSRTESVCWISGRTDLLSGLLLLASLWAFLAAQDGRRRRLWSLLSPALLALALLAKESAVVLAPLLTLWVLFTDEAPRGGARLRRALVRTAPHWVVAGAFTALLARLGVLGGPAARTFAGPLDHLAYVLQTLDLYGARLLWPTTFSDLVTGLLPEGARDHPLPTGPLAFGGALLAGVIAAALWYPARRRPRLAFALAAWPVSLLPALNIVPLPGVAAVRLLYVPGFFAAAALGLAATAAGPRVSPRLAAWPLRYALPALLLAAMGAVSYRQSGVWRDEATFWDAQLRAAPNSANALFLSAWSLADGGAPEAALPRFERALAIAPDNPLFLLYRGNAQLAARRPADAERSFRRLLALGEGDGTPADRLAVALAEQGRLEEGLPLLERAVARAPDNAGFLADQGVLLMRARRPAEAAPRFEAALRLEPGRGSAWAMLARARVALGDRAGAAAAVGRGLGYAPADPQLQALRAELARPAAR